MSLSKNNLVFTAAVFFLFLCVPLFAAETTSKKADLSTKKIVGPSVEVPAADHSEEEIAALNSSSTGSREDALGKRITASDVFEAPPQPKKSSGKSLYEIGEEYGFKPEAPPSGKVKKKKGTQVGMARVWGSYRLAAGQDSDDFILNDANSALAIQTLQGPQSDYIFGERRENTYDPGIYSQYKLNLDLAPKDKWDFYTQIVLDPWSWVGTTGEQEARSNTLGAQLRYNLKYFGAFNSTIPETYRDSQSSIISFPYIKVNQGHLTGGSQGKVTSGIADRRYNVPELNLDTELRPFRKMWVDYKEDRWKVRVFALADEEQALTTDDPLELSNHRDYWQQSPWLYQYKPIQYFTDNSIKRGYYSDALSYYARDSEGNRLVLLRGAAYEGEFDKTSIASTVAAPYTPWDDKFDAADNLIGATRVKHNVNEKWMLGGTHTYRMGLIDNGIADSNQVWSVDTKIGVTDHMDFVAQFAHSYRGYDLIAADPVTTHRKGNAVKAQFQADHDHKKGDGHTQWQLSYAQMDRGFQPLNSQYLNTRDDRFWGTHVSFDDHPDLEPFKLGDGLDVNRIVTRFHWKEKLFKDRFYNEFDIRNVHKAEHTRYFDITLPGTANDRYSDADTSYVETVTRDEITFKLNPRVTAKGLFRWRALPKTTANMDPIFTGYYFPKEDIDLNDFYVQNESVVGGRNADQFTYSGGLQYVIDPRLTAEGIYERTNAVPDFPRGLLNDFTSSNPAERVDGILIDRVQNFMYFQGGALKASAPYAYYNIFKERFIYRPESRVTYTLHATQNEYNSAGGIDDNINHIGLGMEFIQTKKLKWFCDYTFSRQMDVPGYVATDSREAIYDSHHNFYTSFDYKLTAASTLRGEYGVFGFAPGLNGNPYNAGTFSLPTVDTEHLFRITLTGEF